MSERWHVSILTPAEMDVCVAILDTCQLISEDAIAHLAISLLCGVVDRAGLTQREFVVDEWNVDVWRPRG